MEYIIYHSIINRLNENNILIENQHGFRSNHSCITQLITLTEDISFALDHQKQIDIILSDFSKAFDTVPHQRLMTKLRYYGINGSTYNWIQTWLTQRTQCVILNSESSSPVSVMSGVPQGTVLGPLMFLLYINDITKDINSPLRLFADDCLLYRVINSVEDINRLQEDLINCQNGLILGNLSSILVNVQLYVARDPYHHSLTTRVNYLFSDTMFTRTLVLVNCWTESYENWCGNTLHIAQLYLQC